jgi:MFS family permease
MATHQALSGTSDEDFLQRLVSNHHERFGEDFWATFTAQIEPALPPQPMIVDLGFSDLDYISANKLWGFGALIVGSALGAPFILWLGMGRALLISGLMMMFSNVMFMILAATGNNYWMMVAAICTENLTSGIGLTVFTTYLSGLSSIAYTATQFALLSSFAGVGRTFMAGPAGIVAEEIGWVGFWGFTVVAAIPGMILLWVLWSKGYVVQSIRQADAVWPHRRLSRNFKCGWVRPQMRRRLLDVCSSNAISTARRGFSASSCLEPFAGIPVNSNKLGNITTVHLPWLKRIKTSSSCAWRNCVCSRCRSRAMKLPRSRRLYRL